MKKFLTSIWFLSAIIAVPIIIFMPSLFDKYVVKEVSKEAVSFHLDDPRVFYDDLYGDNTKTRVLAGNKKLYGTNRRVVEYSVDKPLFVFYGSPGRIFPKIFFGDIDNDSRREILGFTYASDSLYLNICKLGIDERRTLPNLEKHFIEFPGKNMSWTRIESCDFVDFDNDGINEVVFSLVSHNQFDVRSAIMIYDSATRSIKSSKVIGDQFRNLQFLDIDGDGIKEILADGQNAVEPEKSELPLNTGHPYLKILDRHLNFKNIPLSFKKGETNSIFLKENREVIVYTLSNSSLIELPQCVLYKLNANCEILDSLEIEVDKRANICHVETTGNGNIMVFTAKGKIHIVNKELKLLEVVDLGVEGKDIVISGVYDINEDGEKEIFCHNFKTGDDFIYTEQFSEKVKYGSAFKTIYWQDCKIRKNHFFGQDEKFSYIFRFRKNPYRLLEFPLYAGIYLLLVFFSFVIRKTQEARLKEKYELQNKVREMQLQSLNNQLDPHFIFNTFNTVASVIRQGKSEDAYNLMVRFSKLVRQNMEGSGDIYTTLQKELNFIEDYLSIQKFRFKELLDYSIVKPRNINAIKIPKLLIQIHVENALTHGIRPSKNRGMLKVIVKYETDSVLIEVEDNGVGRSKSKKLKTQGQGIGLKAINEIIEINNINSKHKINQQIIDLKDELGQAIGTRVCLRVTI